MADIRRPPDGFAVSVMLALCLCWGLQQVAMKVAAPVIAPVMQIALRSAVAAVMVAAVMAWRGVPIFERDGTLRAGLVAGALFAGEFVCVALGLTYTSASHMSVFLYTAPIFTTLGLHLWVPGERMRPVQWAGVLLAFGGVAAAFADGFGAHPQGYPRMWAGDALGVVAGLLWGLTTVAIRASTLSEAPPTKTLLYQLSFAAVGAWLFAAVTGVAQIGEMTGLAAGSLVYQTLVVAFASFLMWFWLLRRYLASRLSVFTFLTPVFGIAMGVLLLRDPLSPGFVVGAVLILAGIALVNLPQRR